VNERPPSPKSEIERFATDLDPIRLQHRMQDAGLMSGRVAHAFDNILTGILGFAELTMSQTEARSPVRPFLEEVLRAAQHGVEFTQQLHMFSRCATLTHGPTDLACVAADEEARLRSAVGPGVTLHFAVPADLPPVALEPDMVRQILAHLLDNAREALPGKGIITLQAQRGELRDTLPGELLGQPVLGPCVEVIVADTGPGLTAEARRRLFQEPFFTTKPRHRGLGLAVVYRILQAHRGCFRLESCPGQGTAVHLFLPLAPPGGRTSLGR